MTDYDLLPDDKEEDDPFERSDELFEARREEAPVHLEEFFTESYQEKRMAIQDSQAELISEDDDFQNLD